MKYLVYILAILVLLALDVGLFGQLRVFGAAPNLLFILVVLAALEKKDYDFFFLAFFSGLFLDFYSGLFVGSYALGLVLLAFGLNFLVQNFIVADVGWKYFWAIILVSLVLIDVFIWVYGQAVFRLGWFFTPVSGRLLLRQFVPQLCYNLILLFPVYWLFEQVKVFIRQQTLRQKRRLS